MRSTIRACLALWGLWCYIVSAQAAVTLSAARWELDPPVVVHNGARQVFRLSNSGAQRVAVEVVEARAPLSAKLTRGVIEPGQTAQLIVALEPQESVGEFRGRVVVQPQGQPPLTLAVHGRIVAPPNPLPAAVRSGQLYQPRPGDQPVVAQVFYNSNCESCVAWLRRVIDPLASHFGRWVSFERRDLKQREVHERLELLRPAYHTEQNALTWLFVGSHALAGPAIDPAIYGLLLDELARPTTAPHTAAPPAGGLRLGLLGALTLGLLDGLNPCAFATIVFLIALLTRLGADPRTLLAASASYVGAVFVTYTLLGLGLWQALGWLGAARALRWGVAGFALCFAGLQLRDAVRLRRGAPTRELNAQLPKRLQRLVHALLRWSTRPGRTRWLLAGAMAGAGGLVTLVEMVCTSEVYLPVLALLPTVGVRSRAMALLLSYNTGFVLPLVAVVGLAVRGVGSERLAAFARRHLATVKVGLALLLVGLALLLVLR